MKTAPGALRISVYQALTSGAPPWAGRVYPNRARSDATRPYVVVVFMGGGESNQRRIQDAEQVLGIKCVADDWEQAEAGSQEITTRLNDKGLNDVATGYLDSTDWWIMTSTQEQAISQQYEVDNRDVYEEGHTFRFVMETK